MTAILSKRKMSMKKLMMRMNTHNAELCAKASLYWGSHSAWGPGRVQRKQRLFNGLTCGRTNRARPRIRQTSSTSATRVGPQTG
jgi:hypothetical protein